MQFTTPQDKSERAWLNGEVTCEFDDCQDQAIGVLIEGLDQAGCDWHASSPERQAMMPRRPVQEIKAGDWVIIDGLEDLVDDSQPFGTQAWELELRDLGVRSFPLGRPVATWDRKILTRGAPG